METIMPPNFMANTKKIVAEVRERICIDDVDVEVIKKTLQDVLEEYYRMGYDDGYYMGYDNGYDEGHYESLESELCRGLRAK